MNSKLIATLVKHKIYLIEDKNIKCLIGVPINEIFNETSISIELKSTEELDKLDYDKNDENWINDNINNLYKSIDDYNITLVVPFFSENIVSNYLKNQNEGVYPEVSKIISYLINNVYSLLKSANLKVKDNDVINIISNNEYEKFVNWFVTKYSSRINKTTLGYLVEHAKNANKNYQVVETPDMNFVVGKTTIPHEEAKLMATQSIPITALESFPSEREMPKEDNRGFVGYYLLGGIVLIVCFIFLYIVL